MNRIAETPLNRRMAFFAGLYAVLGGSISLAGWVLDVSRLTDWNASGISIQPNATLCVILCGTALLSLSVNRSRIGLVCGVLVLFIAGLTGLEWISAYSFGVDTPLMFGREWGRKGVVFPGRMGPPGTFCWTLIGIALIVSSRQYRFRRWAAALALTTMAASALSLIGYLYGVDRLFSLPYLTIIALQTSTFIFAVSIGVIVSNPESAPMSMLADQGEAGRLARRALPLMLIVPVAVEFLRVKGQQAGLIDSGLGTALVSLILIGFLAVLMWWVLNAVREREQELAAESRQRRLITDAVPALISYIDAEGRYQFNNKTYQDWFGQEPEELKGRALRDAVGREVFELAKPHIEAALAGKRVEFEAEMPFRFGGARHVHVVYVPDVGPDETVAGFFALVTDISERRKNELELETRERSARRDEARLKLTLTTARMAAWEYDPETDEIYHTKNLDELYGLLPGTSVRSAAQGFPLVHPEDVAAHRALSSRVATEGGSYRSVFRLIRPIDGQIAWIEERGYAERSGPNGEMRLRGIVSDISERRKAEEQLRDSEERLRVMADAMPQIVYVADANGKVEFVNRQWIDYTGQSNAQTADLSPLVHPEDLGGMLRQWEDARAHGTTLHTEFRLKRKSDDEYRWFLTRAVPTRDGDAHVVRWYGTSTDIHDRKMAEEALLETDRQKDEFLATLAHELRNPLAPVRNAVQVLHMKGPAIPELQWARDIIDRQITLMARLIDDLMDVSRINRGKVDVKLERIDLGKALHDAVETSRPLIQHAGHDLHVHLPAATIYVRADLMRLAQAFSNLLNNAAKYTERGGTIVLTAEKDGTHVVVTVKDSGIGIPKNKLESIFQMFAQVHGALERSQGGLGIGLALAKRLVEMHDGTIEARSEGSGMGSEFIVRLPIAVDQAPVSQRNGVEMGMPKALRRILVVDDNRDVADSLAVILQSLGNEICIGYDGEEAVRLAEQFQPQVVLLDIGMPKLNGYDACRRIRQTLWGKRMILIAVTGWGQEGDKLKAHDSGFDHHIVKPVDPRELIRMLGTFPAQ